MLAVADMHLQVVVASAAVAAAVGGVSEAHTLVVAAVREDVRSEEVHKDEIALLQRLVLQLQLQQLVMTHQYYMHLLVFLLLLLLLLPLQMHSHIVHNNHAHSLDVYDHDYVVYVHSDYRN